jgi:hypothetical protein
MPARQKRALRWFTFLLYAYLVLFTGFFHTETSPRETKDCPACNFLRSAVGVSPAPVYIPVVLIRSERIEPDILPAVKPEVVVEVVSRAPPLG